MVVTRVSVRTSARSEMLDITPLIEREIAVAGFTEGLCVIYVPHTTAGVTINEGADPAVCRDILNRLEALVPRDAGYRHAEGNADSHIKASLMGNAATVLVNRGRLVLGTWQRVFFCEFDGPRSRQVEVGLR